MKNLISKLFIIFITIILNGQTHLLSDPFNLLLSEHQQYKNRNLAQSNLFRPLFYNSDTTAYSIILRNESYFNNNAPNQENMDVRYFSKGTSNFTSLQVSFNSPFLSFIAEPYIKTDNFFDLEEINRSDNFSVLNDQVLSNHNEAFRNLLLSFHYKGFGFGWHKGNRWWGPGIHSSLQMTNNTQPFLAQIIGTIQEIRVGRLGIFALFTFANLNDKEGAEAEYLTSLNGQLTWYGKAHLTLGFSRNYITGGSNIVNYVWTESDAKKIIFEGIFTSNLLDKEYSIGGHDFWDQTLSGYITINFPDRGLKIYSEFGFNDNRMYFADFLSQPDHSMATVIGIRDYRLGNNVVWGFEWTNLMITYSSRHRPTGIGTWYERKQYDYSTYKGRRWAAHSGSDSDDWYLYAGYLSDNLMFIPALNYERHGIVSKRPAEVKLEFRLDSRYKYKDIWFGIYYEKQFEAFLGFPKYFYEDKSGNKIDASEGLLANRRTTNTIIVSLTKILNF